MGRGMGRDVTGDLVFVEGEIGRRTTQIYESNLAAIGFDIIMN